MNFRLLFFLTLKIVQGKTTIADHCFFFLEPLNTGRCLDLSQPLRSPESQGMPLANHGHRAHAHRQKDTLTVQPCTHTVTHRHTHCRHTQTHTQKHTLSHRDTDRKTHTDTLSHTQTHQTFLEMDTSMSHSQVFPRKHQGGGSFCNKHAVPGGPGGPLLGG